MKRIFAIGLTAGMLLAASSKVLAADGAVTVKVDDKTISFSNQSPVIVNGRTLIPLRGVFEEMGYSIAWESNTKTAVLTSSDTTVRVSANSSTFTVNGESKALDVPAQIMNGSMMLPLRAVGEAAGANVTWNGDTKTVLIDTKSLSADERVKASDYLVSYAAAVEPLNDVSTLCSEMNALSGEITTTELQSYRVRIYNALQTIETVKADVAKLDVPSSMTELHSVRVESIDKLSELLNVCLDYCDGKLTESEASEKISAMSTEIDDITRRRSQIMDSFSSELLS
jgi:hypothetical protein